MGRFDALQQLDKEPVAPPAPLPPPSVISFTSQSNEQATENAEPTPVQPEAKSIPFTPTEPLAVQKPEPKKGSKEKVKPPSAKAPRQFMPDQRGNPSLKKLSTEVVQKYTTKVKPTLVHLIKIRAAQRDIHDYDVVEEALIRYFEDLSI